MEITLHFQCGPPKWSGSPFVDARKIKVWADCRFNIISGDADFDAKMEASR